MQIREMFQAARYCDKTSFEQHGPILSKFPTNKENIEAEPWLGVGYYFWDSIIADARWWGETHYHFNYIIARSFYNAWSDDYLDLTDVAQRDDFFIAYFAMKEKGVKNISLPKYIEIRKNKDKEFQYKAIKAWPFPSAGVNVTEIPFPDNRFSLKRYSRIQICVIDKSFLHEGKFEVVEEHNRCNEYI